jgi:hypothetical protein
MAEKSDTCKNWDLKTLKSDYLELKTKYSLPDFSELNIMFDIEDICDVETEFLLRKIRRIISERAGNYVRFFEVILNPSNAPLFFFKIIKRLGSEEKELVMKAYDLLGTLELEAVKLDLKYSESDEAEFIKKAYGIFAEKISKETIIVVEKMISGEGTNGNNNKSYFG